ncbi:hypothetical protein [Mesorhizobium sp. M1365]|uniref:hypothetical protein n=1 Tax=Mesorhizobium sp. M1365 TaxID=2957090 RepID=UPI0033373BD2
MGAFAFTQAASQTFYGLSRLGTDAGIHVRLAGVELPVDKRHAEAILGEGLTIFVLIVIVVPLVMILGADWIAQNIFGAPELADFLIAGAAFFVGQTLSQYCYTVYAGLGAFRTYSKITGVTSVIAVFSVTIGGFVFGASGAAWGLVGAQILGTINLAIGLKRLFTHLGLKVTARRPARETIAIFSIGMPFYAAGLLLIPAEFISNGILTQVIGVKGLGDLRVIQTLMSIATVVPISLSGPMISFFADRHGFAEGPGAVLLQLKAIWIGALAMAVCLAGLWPFLVHLLFGNGFGTAQSFGMLALAAFIPTMILTVLTGALFGLRKSAYLFVIGACQASTLGIGAWLLVSEYGLSGLLIAQTVSVSVAALLSFTVFSRQFRPRALRPWMVPMTAMTLVVFALLLGDAYSSESTIVRLAVTFSTLIVCGLVVANMVISREERIRISDALRALLTVLRIWLRFSLSKKT